MENKRLFIDDFEIESTQNLRRTFHPPEKIGTVLQPDRSWEDRSGCACPMVIRDPEGQLKMWYWNSKDELNDLYATSEDGLHWEKPILHLAEIDGSTENNKVQTQGGSVPAQFFSVLNPPFLKVKTHYIELFRGSRLVSGVNDIYQFSARTDSIGTRQKTRTMNPVSATVWVTPAPS